MESVGCQAEGQRTSETGAGDSFLAAADERARTKGSQAITWRTAENLERRGQAAVISEAVLAAGQPKLLAIAKAKGISPGALVREAVNRMVEEAPAEASVKKEPTVSARGILAKYGSVPSAEEIDQNRAEMFANFPGPARGDS